MANYQVKGASADEVRVDEEDTEKKEWKDMGDIAGLLALLQNNKGMDIPGLLALCKDKGYDKAWGGEGMFMFVFLILFLFAGGGWGNLGNRDKEHVSNLAGTALNDIIGIHDRISTAQAANAQGFNDVTSTVVNSTNSLMNASTQGFAGLNTALLQGFNSADSKLCQSIAEVISSVRNQGDRTYDATRTVGDAVRDCCCVMNNHLDKVQCAVDGLYGHVSLAQERTVNVIDRRHCETDAKIEALKAEMQLGFERTNCNITNTAREQELSRLSRENEQLKNSIRDQNIADMAVARMQQFAFNNYKPTSTASSAS